MQITRSKMRKMLPMLEAGKTYREVGKKFGFQISSIYRTSVLYGKPRGWKQEIRRDKNKDLMVELSTAVCDLPDLRKVCRNKKLSYFNVISKTGIRVRKIKCYKKARNICRICGIDISNRAWQTRLCLTHKREETRRQVRLLRQRRKRNLTVVRRVHAYYKPLKHPAVRTSS
jgi:hypothetical protein